MSRAPERQSSAASTEPGRGDSPSADNPMAPRLPHYAPRAKRVIYLHMSGGPPQQDLFDYKPTLVKHNM